MELIVAGNTLQLQSLDAGMDVAFTKLHSAWLSSSATDAQEFNDAALLFFANHIGNWAAHDAHFNNFTIIWNKYRSANQFDRAEDVWRFALRPAWHWEQTNPGQYIHKGTAYYFWAVTAIERGELDKGYFLMHQAVAEDARTSGEEFPQRPATYLATLNYQPTEQAFRGWILEQAHYLYSFLEDYRANRGGLLTIDDLRRRFLTHPPSRAIVFLFAFGLARASRIQAIPPFARQSPFAGQLQLNLLFDLTLVIDGAIKAKSPSVWKFIDLAAFLNGKRRLGLNKTELRRLNKAFNHDFETTLQTYLDGLGRLTNGSTVPPLAADLGIAYGIRNRGAHGVEGTPSVWTRFGDIHQSLLNTLFWAVEDLY
jgi:hypothetical protein